MFLSIVFAIFVWPAIAIYGLSALVSEIRRLIKKSRGEYEIPTYENKTKQPTVRYEAKREEERRINQWGCDDERWGKL